jgi:hypothetical protein
MRKLSGYGSVTCAAVWLMLAGATLPAMAGTTDFVGEDTMIVVEQGAVPEDIINVIRLPGVGAEGVDGPNAAAREAAAEIAEQARSRAAEIAADAQERAADIAESMREAAEDMREELTPPVGPPTDLDLPEQAEGPP